MKLKNTSNRIGNWLITANLIFLLWCSQGDAQQAHPQPANGAGPVIGVTCLIICGVVIYTLIYTCKKCFPNTNTNNIAWSGSCTPIYTSTCPDVPCDDTNALLLTKFSNAQWIVLERSTNCVNWDAIDAKWENLDAVEFRDNYPPQPAFYRFLLEY